MKTPQKWPIYVISEEFLLLQLSNSGVYILQINTTKAGVATSLLRFSFPHIFLITQFNLIINIKLENGNHFRLPQSQTTSSSLPIVNPRHNLHHPL